MKRMLIVGLLIVVLFGTNLFAIRLGAQIVDWNGFIQGQFYQGALVQQTAPGYPAWNTLFPGDIITEGILIPNSQIWQNPGNPQQGYLISFNPYAPLNQQLWNLQQYGLAYNYQGNVRYATLLNMIQTAPYFSNVVFRVWRPQWNSWTLISVVLDTAGQGSIWVMPQPQVQGQIIIGPGQIVVQPQIHIGIQLWIRF